MSPTRMGARNIPVANRQNLGIVVGPASAGRGSRTNMSDKAIADKRRSIVHQISRSNISPLKLRARTLTATKYAISQPTNKKTSRFISLPNVKDEPRHRPARRVPHHDSHSVVSFRTSFGSTRRDRSDR